MLIDDDDDDDIYIYIYNVYYKIMNPTKDYTRKQHFYLAHTQ